MIEQLKLKVFFQLYQSDCHSLFVPLQNDNNNENDNNTNNK